MSSFIGDYSIPVSKGIEYIARLYRQVARS